MNETRITYLLAAAGSTFAVGLLVTFGLALGLRAAHVDMDAGTSWVVPAAGCSAAAALLFGRPPARGDLPDTTVVESVVLPPAQPFIGPVDYKLPHDAFRAASRRVTKLTFRHDEAVKAGTESADFAAGYRRAVQDLDQATLEEFAVLSSREGA